MLLNHEIGEIVEEMDDIFHVVPVTKYADMPRLTTVVKRMSRGKFKRLVDVEVPIFEAALQWAHEGFSGAGILPDASIDCIAQEYPRTGCVCFVFATLINGEAKFVTAPFKLGDEQIADLTVRGLWTPYRVN
jgi:hypothetical protein